MAALTKMSQRSHRQVRIEPGDTVIISATPIPGNERLVARTIDNLFHLGAEVVYRVDGTVHVSGHASQEEIKTLINIVKPKYLMLFHGEYRHKVHITSLAVSLGIPESNVIKAICGERWVFSKGTAALSGKVPAGEIMVDGLGIGDVGSIVLHDRLSLSTEGVIVVALVIDKNTGVMLAGPDIVSRGFVYIRENMELMDEARKLISKELNKLEINKLKSWAPMKDIIVKLLSTFLFKNTGRRPMILPIIQEYED